MSRWLRNLAKFGEAHKGVLGMIESWCEHGQSPPCQLTRGLRPKDAGDDEDMFFTVPLAEYNVGSMPWHQLAPRKRIRLLHETLEGLGAIHKKGFIHGGIQPDTLFLLRSQGTEPFQEGMRAAIGGMLYACHSPSRKDKPPNRSIWLAPEVITSSMETPYTNKADRCMGPGSLLDLRF